MKNGVIKKLQIFGDSVTDYIAIIPIGALLYGIGLIITNANISGNVTMLNLSVIQTVGRIIREIGNFILNNMALIFACSIAGKLCDGDHKATGAAVLTYMVFNLSISAIMDIDEEMIQMNQALFTRVLGIPTLSTGVFGGILCALLVVFVYKRFKDIRFVSYLALFEGKNFVLLFSIFCGAVAALPVSLVWPYIQTWLNVLTAYLIESNSILSPFIYILLIRYLIPVGLSALVFIPINYQLGTYITLSGEAVHGTVPMFIAQLADGVLPTYSRFLSGLYLLPAFTFGMVFAIILSEKEKKREKLMGLYVPGLISTFLTGITDPVEYTFMYKQLPLYYMHATFIASGAILTNMLHIYTGTSFCGGLIEYIFYGVMYRNTKWYLLIPLNLIVGVLYYLLCRFLIKKYKIHIFDEEDENSVV